MEFKKLTDKECEELIKSDQVGYFSVYGACWTNKERVIVQTDDGPVLTSNEVLEVVEPFFVRIKDEYAGKLPMVRQEKELREQVQVYSENS
jgi:hypothetical protein